MALTPEGRVKKELQKLCDRYGAIFHNNVQSIGSVKGFPDNSIIRVGGETAYVECKRAEHNEKHLRPDQVIWKERLIKQGAPWFFFNGTLGLEEITKWLMRQ